MVDEISIVVGATSGIGRSLALALARERKRVGVIGRNEERLSRVAREVEMFGGRPFAAVSDVREPVSIQAALAQITIRGWTIDQVFLSAGIYQPVDLNALNAEEVESIFDTNVFGVTNWLEALQPFLAAQRHGATVAVLSSLAADRAIPGGGAAYSASKAAVSALLDGLRAPWATQGIRLVTVAPGFVQTPMTAGVTRLPLVIQPDEAAQTTLDGLRRGQPVLRFPLMAALTMSAVRALPARWLDLLYRTEPL